ncbi:Monocarboxylate transporter [Wickerhamomyces ciferrii]|uniref:Monocarboxylate transporter n=1 Tax=Wickerhamomyces ciferrii (strain ATCC 14091 / BCRC 22168 / CBS 111 / JCM 3599 / NBRC 0793 / NRRL Y-1031 F-60-10) TaxID=1206466 RepID=K0KT96_WICCF|nr:Monocarboxylate transporter [Wickerhamomyces ciferrii]CCH44594.1 Monocarboxylate transporter [Wickerhamomyces ciferrii]
MDPFTMESEKRFRLQLLLRDIRQSSNGLKIVLAGFLSNFIVFGIAFSFGVFQEYYTTKNGPLSNYDDSAVAMIGTAASSLTYMGGIFNKTLLFYFTTRTVMVSGGIMMGLGLILGGFCHSMYQFVLSQGVLYGIGSSFLYMPPVVCAPMFFNKNRAIAMGVLFSGSGFGGLAMATLSRYLITKFGWQWCLRIEGFMSLGVCLIAAFLVEIPQNVSNQFQFNSRKILTLSQLKSWKVWMQLAASLLQSAGYLIPLIFMSKYGKTLGFTDNQGAIFIGLNNVINAIFKIILGFVADKVGRLNMIVFCSVVSTITILTLWLIASRETFISFVILYGVFSGAIISLLPTCLVELFGAENYQSMSGLMYFSRGVGTLLGSPLAGLLIKNSGLMSKDYKRSIIYNGVLLFTSTLCLVVLKFQDKIRNLN